MYVLDKSYDQILRRHISLPIYVARDKRFSLRDLTRATGHRAPLARRGQMATNHGADSTVPLTGGCRSEQASLEMMRSYLRPCLPVGNSFF